MFDELDVLGINLYSDWSDEDEDEYADSVFEERNERLHESGSCGGSKMLCPICEENEEESHEIGSCGESCPYCAAEEEEEEERQREQEEWLLDEHDFGVCLPDCPHCASS